MSNSPLRDLVDSSSRANPLTPNKSWRVVIADDEALPAELLKRSLMRLGHTVVGSAQNGLEVIRLVRELKPDLVVMDLRMPVMDGWTAMAELSREMLAPIVVVSALDDYESLEQAVFAGASAFLTKPVREDDFERALELAVARFADLKEIHKWRTDAEQRAREQALQTEELARVVQELRAVQLQLVNAARRAAVASLAHGLAHEINNALTPIIGNAQIIAMLRDQDSEIVQRANQIMEHARRIAGWTASFRQVTNGGSRQKIAFSYNGIVRDVLRLYPDRFQRLGIVTEIEQDPELPVMYGHADQVQEILMSLFQNAVEAMREGGTLRVVTRAVPADRSVLTVLDDSGTGIRPEDLPRVFEPGFTTKATGDRDLALGWGLFTVKQILKAHGGGIEILSPAEGASQGTTVRLTLPLNAE